MGLPLGRRTYSGWDPPTRIVSLEYYIRKPKPKSKLSKELREYEEEEAVTKEEDIMPEGTSRPSTANAEATNLCASEAKTTNKSAPPEDAVPSPASSQTFFTHLQPKYCFNLAPLPPPTTLSAKPPKLANIHPRPLRFPISKQKPSRQDTSTCSHVPLSSLPHHPLLPPIFHRYLAGQQEHLSSATAKDRQSLINLQAAHEQQRLICGLDPRSYQAKGKIISIYGCNDGTARRAGVAIEVIHAPLGFPNQETWLWESMRDLLACELEEGRVVLFQIVWEMEGNHWEVVDVRG